MEDFATVFFLPVYFAYTGLRTEVGLLESAAMWLTCGLLITVAVVGKFGGGALAARMTGLSWRESAALGALVNTRGLMELIILNVGLDLGLITPVVFAMMVVMAIVTTAMTAPALSLIDPQGRLQEDAIAIEAPTAPGSVLVPVAFSASGPALLDMAVALAEAEAPRVYALHIARPVERGTLGANLPLDGSDTAALAPLLARASQRGTDVHPVVLTSRTPADDICEVARLKGARLIVMGWHKPVFAQSVLGGTLERVLRRATADVVILIDKGLPERIGSILLPYTGTVHDRLALQLATRLARRATARFTLLHIVRPGRGTPHLERDVQAVVDSDLDPTTGERITVEVVESTEPVDVVIATAARHDLTVLGIGEEWQLARSVLGLRSERVAVETPSSLLIIRAAP
jgi:nucleotide-binding universal stress UspA family protein